MLFILLLPCGLVSSFGFGYKGFLMFFVSIFGVGLSVFWWHIVVFGGLDVSVARKRLCPPFYVETMYHVELGVKRHVGLLLRTTSLYFGLFWIM